MRVSPALQPSCPVPLTEPAVLFPLSLVFAVASAQAAKSTECYLSLLYTMEDVAVYGYVTPLRVKIILALALTDAVVRDADVIAVRILPRYLSPTF